MNRVAHHCPEAPAAVETCPEGVARPPCFFSALCGRRAEFEKAGRSVCRHCAAALRGNTYPLRPPTLEPLYFTGREAAEALDMVEKW